jgi:hypothetical protein
VSQPYFRTARRALGPAWLTTGKDSLTVGFTLDALKDAFTERLRQGQLTRFPQQDPSGTPSPDDALAALGRDRGIVRGIAETSDHYAARMITWLDDHATAGNPFALMQQLAGYTGPGPAFRTVDVRGNWYSRDGEGNVSALINQANWDWDSDPYALTYWSRFWVIIYPNGLWSTAPALGSGGPLGTWPGTIGSTATLEEVSDIRGIVKSWKPAGTRCVNIILAFDNTSFDPTTARDGTGLPDGTWGHWSKISGSGPSTYVPSRLSTARYWDGT